MTTKPKTLIAFVFLLTTLLCCNFVSAQDFDQLRIMSWNIWHGGREDGKEVGPKRVIEVIQQSNADIVAMQETYGSGEIISKALGFHFQPRGTNLSIHSRFPIVEDISVFEEFKCVGGLVELPDKSRIAFYCIWLPYGEDIWLPNVRDKSDSNALLKACQPSHDDLKKILEQIKKRLSDHKYDDVPVIISGDFNSMSHLDYSLITEEQFGSSIQWTTSQLMTDRGFRDTYRETNPIVDRKTDSTWSPKFPEQEQDRIDFIYYLADRSCSANWRARQSNVLRQHAVKFPSDHAAVLTTFEKTEASPDEINLTTVTYNIKRGFGNDSKTDISRAADVLKKLDADFVGLQEVDLSTKRSGRKNQPAVLGELTDMHAAFGSFMDYQGGKYGLAILSRHPIKRVREVELPIGREPRVALVVEAMLPNDEVVTVVNVHFDYPAEDKARYAQASKLREFLKSLKTPCILLGDFNDQPGSRTIKLFQDDFFVEATKPSDDRFTFSATNPQREIDFIFAGPKSRWSFQSAKVIEEPVVSDHRPVIAQWMFRADAK